MFKDLATGTTASSLAALKWSLSCIWVIFYPCSGYIINRLSRRKGIAGLNTASMILGLMFLFPFVHESKVVSTVLLGLGRFTASNFDTN